MSTTNPTPQPARDPRFDPHPGDVWRKGDRYSRSYYEILEPDPRFADTDVSLWNVCAGRETVWSLGQFIEWAKTAEVIYVAE